MARHIRITCKILILVTALLFRSSPLADAQEMEVIAGGELEYQNHCAICHGVDGRGQGIMSQYLTVRPADLTRLRGFSAKKKNIVRTSGWITRDGVSRKSRNGL
jgi:cytochrome c553